MNEIWKTIPHYEGLYEVSNLGRIKSIERIDSLGREVKEKIRKTRNKKNGYGIVELSINGIVKTFHIHRLVASAFLNLDIKSELVVCHKDDNPKNNKLDNLFLGTLKDNTQDCIRKGRNSRGEYHQIKNRGELSKRATISNDTALSIKNMLLNGIKHKLISIELGVSIHIIKKISSGKSWKFI